MKAVQVIKGLSMTGKFSNHVPIDYRGGAISHRIKLAAEAGVAV